jgi:hypothetical protein
MYCELCMYFTEHGQCSLHIELTPQQRSGGCKSFVERPFTIGRTAGCCGLSGLPTTDSWEEDGERSRSVQQ